MKKTSCAAWLLCAAIAPAYAAHPLVTDDTGVQGEGHHQLEMNTDWSRQSGQPSHVGAFTYTYGVTDKLDLFANVPQYFSSPTGSGMGDASLGAKWRFHDDKGLSLALKPELFSTSGNPERSHGTGRSSAALSLLGSYESGPWTWHANAGVSYYRYGRDEDIHSHRHTLWRTSAASWYAVNEQWKVVGDVGIAQNSENANRTWPAYALLGVIWSPNDTIDLDIGYKAGLNKAEVTRQVGVGITLHF